MRSFDQRYLYNFVHRFTTIQKKTAKILSIIKVASVLSLDDSRRPCCRLDLSTLLHDQISRNVKAILAITDILDNEPTILAIQF